MDECQLLSLYDTTVTAKYGDKLVTLSTCEYSQKNGRFVVVAKKEAAVKDICHTPKMAGAYHSVVCSTECMPMPS